MTTQNSSLATLDHLCGESNCTINQICTELAKVFRVKTDEVAVLKLHGNTLRFLCPTQLRGAGSIPLSSSAIAAKTATQRPMISNEFIGVRHLAIFEAVPAREENDGTNQGTQPIQKIMSAPIVAEQGLVLGVVQISRKGATPRSAGQDFTSADLTLLESACAIMAPAISRFDE